MWHNLVSCLDVLPKGSAKSEVWRRRRIWGFIRHELGTDFGPEWGAAAGAAIERLGRRISQIFCPAKERKRDFEIRSCCVSSIHLSQHVRLILIHVLRRKGQSYRKKALRLRHYLKIEVERVRPAGGVSTCFGGRTDADAGLPRPEIMNKIMCYLIAPKEPSSYNVYT